MMYLNLNAMSKFKVSKRWRVQERFALRYAMRILVVIFLPWIGSSQKREPQKNFGGESRKNNVTATVILGFCEWLVSVH